MIRVLCAPGIEPAGRTLAQAIATKYPQHGAPELVPPMSVWTSEPAWDDLLLVVHDSSPFPAWLRTFIEAFHGLVIPIGVSGAQVPPEPLSGRLGTIYDGSEASEARIVRAIGVFLGLAIRPGEHVFVSYRSTDGRELAADLYKRLDAAGFEPWLDEAREDLPLGADIQPELDERIQSASLVIVVDTPDAPASRWMHAEISTALARLIPLVPVVVGPGDLSRFLALRQLQRRAPVKPGGLDDGPLSEDEWAAVRDNVQEVLLSTYVRKMRLQATAERVFHGAGYDWNPVDGARRIFRAQRRRRALPPTVVLSHCFVQDITDVPALKSYAAFISTYPDLVRVTHKLCIYADRILSDVEIEDIDATLNPLTFILAHETELHSLVYADFGKLK